MSNKAYNLYVCIYIYIYLFIYTAHMHAYLHTIYLLSPTHETLCTILAARATP